MSATVATRWDGPGNMMALTPRWSSSHTGDKRDLEKISKFIFELVINVYVR